MYVIFFVKVSQHNKENDRLVNTSVFNANAHLEHDFIPRLPTLLRLLLSLNLVLDCLQRQHLRGDDFLLATAAISFPPLLFLLRCWWR